MATRQIILSHGGRTLPYAANRIARLNTGSQLTSKSANEFLDEARSFYFDFAFPGYDGPPQLALDFAKPGHVIYDTDYPFGREGLVKPQLQSIDNLLKDQEDAAPIAREVATRLFPRLQKQRT
ncbi:MAG: hypothetical protein M1821_006584 [Bathelium mastoideum]|nr:MAG: hypothetical protein M1821_006584 [Bathelium mastoideum]